MSININLLNLGTTPNDGTGDTLYSGGTKINDNFTSISASSVNWDSAYSEAITGMTITGTTVKTITLEQRDGTTIQANFSAVTDSVTATNTLASNRVILGAGGSTVQSASNLTFDNSTSILNLGSKLYPDSTAGFYVDGGPQLEWDFSDFGFGMKIGGTLTIGGYGSSVNSSAGFIVPYDAYSNTWSGQTFVPTRKAVWEEMNTKATVSGTPLDGQIAFWDGNENAITGHYQFNFTPGQNILDIGEDDTQSGFMFIRGSISNQGGEIRLYNAANNDGVDDFYRMKSWGIGEGNFGIGGATSGYFLNFNSTTQKVSLPLYGTGALSGTPAYNLIVDADGNILEAAFGAGTGDVVKVGTPANNQLGVWTGNGTIEGDAGLTWNGSSLTTTGDIRLNENKRIFFDNDGDIFASIFADKANAYGYGVNALVISSPSVTDKGVIIRNGELGGEAYITAKGFKTLTGTTSQFLKADGSVDSTAYITSSSIQDWLRADVADTKTAGDLTFNDNVKLSFGTGGAEADIYSDGTDLFLDILPASNFYIRNLSTPFYSFDIQTGSLDIAGNYSGASFVTSGGTSSQFVKGDGSLDSNSYSQVGHTHVIANITDFTDNSTNWDSAYNDIITGATFTGSATKTLTLTQRDGGTITANFTDNTGGGSGSGNVVTGVTFDSLTGDLDLNTVSGDTYTANLDGRYTLTANTAIADTYIAVGTDTGIEGVSGFTYGSNTLSLLSPSAATTLALGNAVGTNSLNIQALITGNDLSSVWIRTATPSSAADAGYIRFTIDDEFIYDIVDNGLNLASGKDIKINSTSVLSSSNLGSAVQVATSSLNSGTNASASTYWRGDGSWATPTNVSGATFNTSTGVLEFTNTSGGTFNVDLDNRYSLTGHTHTASEITDFDTEVSNNSAVAANTAKISYNDGPSFSAHTGDTSVHFTQGSISITASQVSDFDTEVANNSAVAANTAKISYTDASTVAATASGLASHTGDTSIHFTQAAISITESQISDLQAYSLTGHTHTGGEVILDNINGAAYTTVQQMQDVYHSTGQITGGVITANGITAIDVSGGEGYIRTSNSDTATLAAMSWSGVTNQVLTLDARSYVYVEYNAGSPQIVITTTERTDTNTNLFLGTAYRDDIEVHINKQLSFDVGDHAAKMIKRLQATAPFARESGGVITEVGTRNLAVSAGVWWEGLKQYSTDAINTSTTDTFTYYYQDGVGGFTEITGSTTIDNLQYDNTSGTLATLSNGKYGIHWVYLGADGSLHVVYGITNGTLQEAEAALPLSSLPPYFTKYARLIGKLVIAKSSATITEIISVYTSALIGSTGLSQVADDLTPELGGNLVTGVFTVDGRDVSADGATLDATAAGLASHTGDTSIHFTQAAISITESQISDLGTYATESNFNSHTGDTSIHFTKGSINLSDLGSSAHTHTISEISDFTDNSTNWNSAYNDTITGATVTGSSSKTITLFQRDGGTVTANFTDISSSGGTGSGNVVTGVTFTSATGDLDLTTASGDTYTANLDGRYLNLTGGTITSGLTISNGGLIVSGITNASTDTDKFLVEDAGVVKYRTGLQTQTDLGGPFVIVGASLATVDTIPYVSNTNTLTSSVNFQYSGDVLRVGSDNLGDGGLYLYGDLATAGGVFRLYNGDSVDTENDYFQVYATTGGDFSMEGSVTGQFFGFDSGTQVVSFPETGGVNVTNDVTASVFNSSGGTSVQWETAYDDSITSISVTGDTTKTITLFQQDGSLLQANFTDNSGGSGSNTYVTGATFNTSDGVITYTNLTGGTFTVDIDDRYSLLGHTHVATDITDFDTEVANNSAVAANTAKISYTDAANFATHTGDTSIHFTQASISITESQISDLQAYSLTGHTHVSTDITNFDSAVSANSTVAGNTSNLNTHTGDTTIHFTQAAISIPASQISDFDTEVSNNTDVAANTAKISYTDAATVAATASGLASHTGDTSIHFTQAAISIPASQISDFDTEVSNNSSVAANTAKISYTDAANFATHTGDTSIHFTQGAISITASQVSDFDTEVSNNTTVVANTSNLNTHTGDTSIHFTQASISITESQISDLGTYATESNFNSHTGDTTIHYTKASINLSDLGSSAHTHTLSEITDFTSTGVTSTSAFGTDNVLLKSDGTGRGLQATGISVNDSDQMVVGGHGTASTGQVVNVCYGTSATPPAAGGLTEGALYIQYTA